MKILIDISKDKYDKIMSMDWKNRYFYDEELKAIHDGKVLEQEPKMGQWIKNAEEWQNVDPPYICSECGRASLRQENFCCSCGADMRGDADADSD